MLFHSPVILEGSLPSCLRSVKVDEVLVGAVYKAFPSLPNPSPPVFLPGPSVLCVNVVKKPVGQ